MGRFAVLTLILIAAGTSSWAHGGLCGPVFLELQSPSTPGYRFHLNEVSKTRSQVIRDNHLDYVFFEKAYTRKMQGLKNPDAQFVNRLISYEGWISGDNHAGNYIVAPLRGRMRYFFVDLKDGGIGPFFFNFANLVVNTHAVAKEAGVKIKVVTKSLTEAYLAGLRGDASSTAKSVQKALEVPLEKYEELREKDARRFVSKEGGFEFKPDRIERLRNPTAVRAQIEAALKSWPEAGTLMDIGIRPKDRGGSRDLLRYWALFKKTDGEYQIVEFKQVNVPAAEVYRKSGLDLRRHLQQMMQVFFGGLDPHQQVVSLGGDLFMMRSRKVELVSVPYKQDSGRDLSELFDLAQSAAFATGQAQRRQPGADDYLALIQKNRDLFEVQVRELVKAYYERLQIKTGDE